jgi:hypothetical protein
MQHFGDHSMQSELDYVQRQIGRAQKWVAAAKGKFAYWQANGRRTSYDCLRADPETELDQAEEHLAHWKAAYALLKDDTGDASD